jgi:hypothetical protein
MSDLSYVGVVFALGMVMMVVILIALYFVIHYVLDERGVGRRKFK